MKMLKIFVLICGLLLSPIVPSLAATQSTDSTFDKVMDSGVLKCGYYVFPPLTIRDPNTNQMSGVFVDIMNSIAEKAHIKIEWSEEVTFGSWGVALQSKRIDAVCTSPWPDLPMARVALFTDPLFFSGMYPFVRENDERFKGKITLDRFNNKDVIYLSQEGNLSYNLGKQLFPNAQSYVLGPEADTSLFASSIVSKKADVALSDSNLVNQWNKNNQDKIKLLTDLPPVKAQQYPLAVQKGDYALLHFLNLAIHEMQYDGEMDRILRKWEPEPGKSYLRVNPAYQVAP